MSAERWEVIERLYHTALDQDPGGARESFLTAACGGDEDLRRELDALLKFDAQAGSFLETPAIALEAPPPESGPSSEKEPVQLPEQIGPYKVLALLGKGGMGEVYLALDPRLRRKVAVKVLPAEFAPDGDRTQRFQQEALAVSALNHPNIITIHEIGATDGRSYIVTELIEGETLRERIDKAAKPGPMDGSLDIAVQVASALEAAHRAGLIHRDIKPENVMVRQDGLVKVLDFGLAKMSRAQALSTATLESLNTQLGIVMGTAAYMSPEQARGEKVDHRTDIFSFGVLLYEMLSGTRPFQGDTAIDVVAAVLTKEAPPLGPLGCQISPTLERIVARCLEKNPDRRFQSAGDLVFALKEVASNANSSAVTPPEVLTNQVSAPKRSASLPARWGRFVLLGAIGVALVAVLAFSLDGYKWLNQHSALVIKESAGRKKLAASSQPAIPPPSFDLPADWSLQWTEAPAVSPDGQHIVFSAFPTDPDAGHTPALWIRSLNSSESRRLAGTEGGSAPFWSPDSSQIGFVSNGRLRSVNPSGGVPRNLCQASTISATWNRRAVILFSQAGRLSFVSDKGGTSVSLGPLAPGELGQANPRFLPDDDTFLYHSRNEDPSRDGVYLSSLAHPGRRERVLTGVALGVYAPPGYLLFVRDQILMAQRFDLEEGRVTGPATPIAQPVASFLGGPFQAPFANFSVSENGVLAWILRSDRVVTTQSSTELTWFDRSGRRLGTIGQPAGYSGPELSPDETRLAVAKLDPTSNARDIWITELTRGLSLRLTREPADEMNPVWTTDGKWVIFSSTRSGPHNLYRKLADGSGDTEPLLQSTETLYAEAISPDGRFLLFNVRSGEALTPDLDSLSLTGVRERARFVSAEAREDQAQFSPDGRWVAYRSDESGQSHVFVRRFSRRTDDPGDTWRVSTRSGSQPRWRSDGKELFYLENDTLMAVDVETSGPRFSAGVPRPLFSVSLESNERRNRYVVTRDGQRFLVCALAPIPARSTVAVQANWLLSLKSGSAEAD